MTSVTKITTIVAVILLTAAAAWLQSIGSLLLYAVLSVIAAMLTNELFGGNVKEKNVSGSIQVTVEDSSIHLKDAQIKTGNIVNGTSGSIILTTKGAGNLTITGGILSTGDASPD